MASEAGVTVNKTNAIDAVREMNCLKWFIVFPFCCGLAFGQTGKGVIGFPVKLQGGSSVVTLSLWKYIVNTFNHIIINSVDSRATTTSNDAHVVEALPFVSSKAATQSKDFRSRQSKQFKTAPYIERKSQKQTALTFAPWPPDAKRLPVYFTE